MIAEAPPAGWDRAVQAVEASRLASLADLPALSGVPTPALVIDAAVVDRNIEKTIARLGGPVRWRAHVKTAKAAWAIERLMAAGVSTFKASTTAELEMTLAVGASDVMLAYSAVGPTLVEAGRLADAYPAARVSALVDDASILGTWPVSGLGAYIDLDPGMHRSGLPIEDHASIRSLASRIRERGIELRGLHEYDGHLGGEPDGPREAASRVAFERLLAITAALEGDGHRIAELVVGGSHTSEASLVELAAGRTDALVRLGPGTVIYGDLTSLSRLPVGEAEPAVAILATVVSRPNPSSSTCDAGLLAIQVDAGLPNSVVAGRPWLEAQRPSQEHLPLLARDREAPTPGTRLMIVPRHVCTSVGQFDEVVIVDDDGRVVVEPVTARGRRL